MCVWNVKMTILAESSNINTGRSRGLKKKAAAAAYDVVPLESSFQALSYPEPK